MNIPDTLHPIDFHAYSDKFLLPKKPHRTKWTCPLPMLRIDEFDIVPLTSIRMLNSEGYHMHNCCKDYAAQCAEGTYYVFSIRDLLGERFATLGAKKVDDHYNLDQCFGPSNSNVTDMFIVHTDDDDIPDVEWQRTELFYVASEVIRVLNKTK